MRRAIAVVLVIAISACGAEESRPSGPRPAAPEPSRADRPEGSTSEPSNIPLEPMLMREASVSLEVEDCPRAMAAIAKIASASHGVVVSTELRADTSEDQRSGTAVFKVPATAFDRTLDDLDGLALHSEWRNVTAVDVTEEYVDLDARLRVKRALETRYLELVQSAGSTADAIEVERSLAAVREDIERIEGRRRYLSSRVELSTITVSIHEPEPFFGSLARAFGLGRRVFSSVISALVVMAVGLSPLALLLFAVVAIGRALYRRRWCRDARGRPAGALRASSVAAPGAPRYDGTERSHDQ
jgi:hypothetical protein